MPVFSLTKPSPAPMGMLDDYGCSEYGAQLDCPYFQSMQAAVRAGSVERMRDLVNKGASLTSTPSGGSSLAHLAAMEGSVEVLAFLAEAIGPHCLLAQDSEGAAPVHWLCTVGGCLQHQATSELATVADRPRSYAHGAPVVRASIGDGASEGGDEKDGHGDDEGGVSLAVKAKVNALRWLFGNVSVLEHVLEAGEIQAGGFRCPAHLAQAFAQLSQETAQAASASAAAFQAEEAAAAQAHGYDDLFVTVDRQEAAKEGEVGSGPVAFMSAAERRAAKKKKAEATRRQSAAVRIADLRDAQQETPLIWACTFETDGAASLDSTRSKERLPLVKFLVKECGADTNAQAANGSTALHCAARGGALSLLRFLLLDSDASSSVRDAHGRTPLQTLLHRIAPHTQHSGHGASRGGGAAKGRLGLSKNTPKDDKLCLDLLRRCTPVEAGGTKPPAGK